jgi:hypothetical protein
LFDVLFFQGEETEGSQEMRVPEGEEEKGRAQQDEQTIMVRGGMLNLQLIKKMDLSEAYLDLIPFCILVSFL